MLDIYLNEKLIHFIANLFEKQDPLPSFDEFKAPKNKQIKKSNKLSKEEKEKLKKESERIKKKFSGGK